MFLAYYIINHPTYFRNPLTFIYTPCLTILRSTCISNYICTQKDPVEYVLNSEAFQRGIEVCACGIFGFVTLLSSPAKCSQGFPQGPDSCLKEAQYRWLSNQPTVFSPNTSLIPVSQHHLQTSSCLGQWKPVLWLRFLSPRSLYRALPLGQQISPAIPLYYNRDSRFFFLNICISPGAKKMLIISKK